MMAALSPYPDHPFVAVYIARLQALIVDQNVEFFATDQRLLDRLPQGAQNLDILRVHLRPLRLLGDGEHVPQTSAAVLCSLAGDTSLSIGQFRATINAARNVVAGGDDDGQGRLCFGGRVGAGILVEMSGKGDDLLSGQ